MKTEKLIVGLILTVIGIFLLYRGYQQSQPDMVERGMSVLSEISRSMGEDVPVEYSRDKTGPYAMMVLGGILAILGLNFVLKSGKPENQRQQ